MSSRLTRVILKGDKRMCHWVRCWIVLSWGGGLRGGHVCRVAKIWVCAFEQARPGIELNVVKPAEKKMRKDGCEA